MHNYFLPPRIEFGDGTIQNLGEHVKAFDGKKPLLVSDAGVINAGILAKAIEALDAVGLSHTTYSDIEPNPTDISITDGVEAYKAEACDVVIAVGGGSVMDAAKAIRLLTTHEPPLEPYYADVGGLERIRDNMPPLICVPTTAGTGSEVSQGSIITDTSLNTTDRWRKRAIVTPFNMSNIALLDPGITLGMPPALTAATGMDAITHGIEAYVATKYHPIAEGVALQALRMLSANIQKVYHDGSDVNSARRDALGILYGSVFVPEGTRRGSFSGASTLYGCPYPARRSECDSPPACYGIQLFSCEREIRRGCSCFRDRYE